MRRFLPLEYLALVTLLLPAGSSTAAGVAVEDALRATVRITSGTASGTGFFVAVSDRTDKSRAGASSPRDIKGQRQVLVTAAHVFDEMKGSVCTVVVRAQGKSGTLVRKEITVPLRDGAKPLWTRHPEMDVAAISVDVPEGIDLKPFAYRQVADEKWAADRKLCVGQEVRIPCFPAQLEANEAGWPVLRTGWIATHPLTPLASAKTMLVDYAQFGGDSGAPVVACEGQEPVVVGLVFAMQRQTDKISMPFEERTVHTPLGLAIAVQSPLLRETIDRLLERE